MFCPKCGTENTREAKFCKKCGEKMVTNKEQKNVPKNKKPKTADKNNNILNRLKNSPMKFKICLGAALLVIIIAVILLIVLLNNPTKKVETYLTEYYDNYTENYDNKELIEIGNIIRANKGNEKALNSLKKQISNTLTNWVKNFNTSYKSIQSLEDSFDKINAALYDIYKYFNGLEYVLTYEEYYDYYEELSDLYNSKYNYLKALDETNDYTKYNYYSNVIESDSYYKKAQEYLNDYVEEEIDNINEALEEIGNLSKDATTKEYLEAYKEKLEYLNNHKYVNYIDISKTEDYQELFKEVAKETIEYTKKYVEELNEELEINEAIDIIEEVMKLFDSSSSDYQELEDLKETYENKLPVSLGDKYLVSSTSGSSYHYYGVTINDKDYDDALSFTFKGENQNRIYRLNNEYKTFKTTIVRGENWDKDFEGEIVIYGDDKELYRSGKITKSNEVNLEISLDITDVDDLKIEFITKSEPSGYANFYIYLVEPYLYK